MSCRQCRRHRWSDRWGGAGGQLIGQTLECRRRTSGRGEKVHLTPIGRQFAGLSGISEKRHRGTCAGQDEVRGTGQLLLGSLGEIRQALDRGDSRPPFQPGRERLTQHPGTGGLGEADCGRQTRVPGRVPTDENCRRRPGSQRRQRGADRVVVDAGHFDPRHRRCRTRTLGPGHIGGQDQRGHHAGTTGGHRIRDIRRDIPGMHGATNPPGHGAGQRIDIGFQRGVVFFVIRRMIADDDHHRSMGPARVVQIGEAVTQTGAQMQQHRGWLFGHPCIAVSRTGGRTLEQRQDSAHLRHRIQRSHEMHLRRTGIGETHLHPVADERTQQGLGSVHGRISSSLANTRAALACR